MGGPVITIITPSYNQGQFLEQTILSVLNQKFAGLQYGVVDGASTDNSRVILERYRPYLDFVIVEPDHGQTQAINKGLRRARGDIVGWLCSDDLLAPGALDIVAQHFADHPHDTWLAGQCLTIDPFGRALHTLTPKPAESLDAALLRSRSRPFELPQPAVFWRRRLHDELGLLDESLHYCMDFEFWCRLLAAGHRPTLLARTLAMYRLHGQSKTCSQSLGFLREHLAVERSYGRKLPLAKRLRLRRWLGYRRRQYEIARGRRTLLTQLALHPWWLASQQVWMALRGCTTA